jgi:hypothetical protein
VSLTTWTPAELLSNSKNYTGKIWRMVEAQHLVSTSKIVDSLDEQELLEDILEESKPPVPAEAADLDYLLFSPFRYDTRPPSGSRFRAITDPGVFYAAELIKTAAAEVGYWRWKFLQDTSGLDRLQPCAFTAFRVPIQTQCIDLREPPFDANSTQWEHPSDYTATQSIGKTAREAAVGAIVYTSVRDPDHNVCIAVLTPIAFAAKKPDPACQTWTLTISSAEAIWMRSDEAFSFKTELWKYK